MHNDDDGPQLGHDLKTMVRLHRRAVLRGVFGLSAGVVVSRLAACVASSSDLALENEDGTCNDIPEETGGPYPGDGTNGKNALVLDGIVRSDLTRTIGGATAPGLPLAVTLRLLDGACAPLANKAIYLWHADANGDYSMYALPNENWCRGIQVTDDDGRVTFHSVFPGCYDGRWPYIHFEIYDSVDGATSSSGLLRTSQLALPEDACNEVYAEAGYEDSVDNFAKADLGSDIVFSDGVGRQLATVDGSVEGGLTCSLSFTVDV